jgi:hypothetical protein
MLTSAECDAAVLVSDIPDISITAAGAKEAAEAAAGEKEAEGEWGR